MAVIEFINRPNKSPKSLKKVIEYILNPKKTKEQLIWGKDCNGDNAFIEMMAIKKSYGKETGRQYVHFVQSFAPYDRITPKIAYEIGKELCERFKDYQVVMATHIDRNHIHNHFVINSVNFETGYKWRQNSKELQEVKDYSDKICRKYGLIIIPKVNIGNYIKNGEYRSISKEASWKYELYLAVTNCIKTSTSKDEFIKNMEKLKYKVDWQENRKYITFTTSSGKKCRNKKLYPPENFTKEMIEKRLSLNKQFANKRELENAMYFLIEAINSICKEPDNHSKQYPLTTLEGQALKEKIIEESKGKGLDWNTKEGQWEI